MEKKKNAVSFMTVVTITGAVISYRIGAGFASGNECIRSLAHGEKMWAGQYSVPY